MSGNSLELQIPLTIGKPLVIPRLIASGMVIILKIGQSAGNKPKAAKQGYGLPSTTERMLVNYEGLADPSWLKIQSTLWRKPWEHRIVPCSINKLKKSFSYVLFHIPTDMKLG